MPMSGASGHRRGPRAPGVPALLMAGLASCVGPFASSLAAGQADIDRVAAAIDAGQFSSAANSISAVLDGDPVDAVTRSALLFQRERMRRILFDFSLAAADAKARVREQVPDLTDAEFTRWDGLGYLERQLIDGRLYYFNRAPSNLFRLSGEARSRRATQKPFVDSPLESPNDYHRKLLSTAVTREMTSIEPQRIRVTQTLTVTADAVPSGETVRAWIPYPRALRGQQEDIVLLGSEPEVARIAPEDVSQRTVYLEKRAEAGQPTAFSISYELTISGQVHIVDEDQVVPAKITPELAPFLSERPPHVVFTNAMRVFSRQVVGDETNPWRVAQKLFAAVDEIPWAGAREYSTITNISDYSLHAGHADCGQQTLLLMTLLRLNGIPSRWQSGMMFSDGDYWNLHDWGWLYIAPYGWMPMDVTFGRFKEDPELEWFYLGGLDGYRIAFNDDFGTRFSPPKKLFRSETVDSQRGEVEWDGGNLYFDEWDYSFNAEIVPVSAAAEPKKAIKTAERPDLSRRGT